jgi:hypothetical protein
MWTYKFWQQLAPLNHSSDLHATVLHCSAVTHLLTTLRKPVNDTCTRSKMIIRLEEYISMSIHKMLYQNNTTKYIRKYRKYIYYSIKQSKTRTLYLRTNAKYTWQRLPYVHIGGGPLDVLVGVAHSLSVGKIRHSLLEVGHQTGHPARCGEHYHNNITFWLILLSHSLTHSLTHTHSILTRGRCSPRDSLDSKRHQILSSNRNEHTGYQLTFHTHSLPHSRTFTQWCSVCV